MVGNAFALGFRCDGLDECLGHTLLGVHVLGLPDPDRHLIDGAVSVHRGRLLGVW